MEFLLAALGVAVAVAMILGARKRGRRAPPQRAEDAPAPSDRQGSAQRVDGD